MKFKNILAITFALIFVVVFIAPSVSAWWIFGKNTGDAKAITNKNRIDNNTIPTSVATSIGSTSTETAVGRCSGTQSMDTLKVNTLKECSANQLTIDAKGVLISTTGTGASDFNFAGDVINGQTINGSIILHSNKAIGLLSSNEMFIAGTGSVHVVSDSTIGLSAHQISLGGNIIDIFPDINQSLFGTVYINSETTKFNKLTGSGTAYACLTSDGTLYRSNTPCN